MNNLHSFTSDQLSTSDNYKLLSGLIIPRTIAWVSTLNEDGSVNLAPFSFFSSVPSSRPLITLGIGNKETGVPKDTVRNLLREKEGVVHIPNKDDLVTLNATSATIPYGQSEVTEQELNLVPSNVIKTPALATSRVRLETKLYKEVVVNDHTGKQDASVLLLEVVNYSIDPKIVDDRYYTNITQLDPLIRLSGPNYGHLYDIYSYDRPDHESQPS
ncbi:flavin reductase [Limosilactobacillus sp. BG-MG3-A]|uniref:Flavin reductase n=1 Tax=Limosilactobacillus agrestis TaxID=2759748 RepID=A0A7W3UHB1_9LACO|nr:flavin reductase [Limosilactobacillus agrestis]MBB1095511.1 flavin reductase [Limosilactobacillus agrestis]